MEVILRFEGSSFDLRIIVLEIKYYLFTPEKNMRNILKGYKFIYYFFFKDCIYVLRNVLNKTVALSLNTKILFRNFPKNWRKFNCFKNKI